MLTCYLVSFPCYLTYLPSMAGYFKHTFPIKKHLYSSNTVALYSCFFCKCCPVKAFICAIALFRPASHDCSFVNRAIKDKKLLLSLHPAVISLKNSFFNYSLYYLHLYNLYYKSVSIITFLLNFFSLQ